MTSSRIRSFSQPDEDRGLQALKGFPGSGACTPSSDESEAPR